MILTDREIKMALARGAIVIDPPPEERAFASTSVDLTLDAALSEFKDVPAGIEPVVDPGLDAFDHEAALTELTERRTIDGRDGYLLQPKRLVLAWTASVSGCVYASLFLSRRSARRTRRTVVGFPAKQF